MLEFNWWQNRRRWVSYLKKVSWNNKDYFYYNTLVAYSKEDKVILNVEHSEYQWITKEKLSEIDIVGYSKEELLNLFEIISLLNEIK